MRKEFNGVVQGISGKKRFLVRFQDGCEKDLSSNQLTTVIVDNIPDENVLVITRYVIELICLTGQVTYSYLYFCIYCIYF